MPFEVVSEVNGGMGVLDGGWDRRRAKADFGINVGCPIVTNGDFVACESNALFPNCLGENCLSFSKTCFNVFCYLVFLFKNIQVYIDV